MQIAGLAPLMLSFIWEKAKGFPYVGPQMKVKEDTISNRYIEHPHTRACKWQGWLPLC